MRLVLILLVFGCTIWTLAQAQIILYGILEYDNGRPVTNTKISIAGGQSAITDSRGQFSIKLSSDFIEGERVILVVHKKDWIINYPLDGEWNLPNVKYQKVQFIKVILVPKGSKALWSHERIEKYIAHLSDELARTKKEEEKKPVDFSTFLVTLAKKYGFTTDEIKSFFDQWAEEVRHSKNFRTQGLSAFYKKNFATAAQNFRKAAQYGQIKLKELNEQTRLQTLAVYINWKDAGNALSNLNQFEEALSMYDSAQALVAKKNYPEQWAEIKNLIGKVKWQLGIRVEAERSLLLLRESEQCFHQAAEIYNRAQFPEQWAALQNNLGNTLKDLAVRSAGTQTMPLFNLAIQAYYDALEVYTYPKLPQDWAMIQNNLGLALYEQGIRLAGEQTIRMLIEAIAAFRQALEVYSRNQMPLDWAMTQNNLANALSELGMRMAGEQGSQMLSEAIDSYHGVLEIYSQDHYPQLWATTQNNLGCTLYKLGIRTDGEPGIELLMRAISAFRIALTVRIRELVPQQWALTQHNLGLALKELGTRLPGAQGEQILNEAITAYHNALEVRDRQLLPQQWAVTENNLVTALKELGLRIKGEQGRSLLNEALYRSNRVMEIINLDFLPLEWAKAQNNLAEIYICFEQWPNAAECYINVLKVYPQHEHAYQTANYLYHDVLYNFPAAFELNQNWITRNAKDTLARCELAEKYFTTGRFTECDSTIVSLVTMPNLETEVIIALRAIDIANQCALQKLERLRNKLDTLVTLIRTQPDVFKINWSFEGIKHFIREDKNLTRDSEWLLALFNALESENRDAIVAGIRQIRIRFSGN